MSQVLKSGLRVLHPKHERNFHADTSSWNLCRFRTSILTVIAYPDSIFADLMVALTISLFQNERSFWTLLCLIVIRSTWEVEFGKVFVSIKWTLISISLDSINKMTFSDEGFLCLLLMHGRLNPGSQNLLSFEIPLQWFALSSEWMVFHSKTLHLNFHHRDGCNQAYNDKTIRPLLRNPQMLTLEGMSSWFHPCSKIHEDILCKF